MAKSLLSDLTDVEATFPCCMRQQCRGIPLEHVQSFGQENVPPLQLCNSTECLAGYINVLYMIIRIALCYRVEYLF